MKTAFARDSFVAALEQVTKVVPTTKAVPILTYFRLDAAERFLRLTGTDLVTTIVVSTPGVAKEEGTALLPAHEFLLYLRSVTLPSVVLVSVDGGLQARVGTNACLWKAPPLDQFPPVVELEDRFTHTLPRDPLVRALRLVKTAAATSAFNPKLEQVGLRRGKVQAADGIRFHEVAIPDADQIDTALPLPFLNEVIALLGSSRSETVDLGIPEDRQSLILRHRNVVLMTRRRREQFPDVTHAFLVPAMANIVPLRLDRDQLLGAIRRVRVMSDPATKEVRITLTSQDFSTATVSTRQPSGAWASETITAEWADGDRMLAFNHEYLTHLLSLFEAGTLTLRLGPDARHKPSPVLIQEGGRSGVLSQLRLDWQ